MTNEEKEPRENGAQLTVNMKKRPTSWHLMTFPANQ